MRTCHQQGNPARADVRTEPGGGVKVVLHGCLDLESTAACWRHLQKQLGRRKIPSLELDVDRLVFDGTIGIALVRYLSTGGMTPGARITVRGLDEDAQKLMDMFSTDGMPEARKKAGKIRYLLDETGGITRSFLGDLRAQIEFIGGVTAALPGAIVRPRRMRWTEVRRVLERAGANALPVIAVFSWLVGVVMALEAAHPLGKLGAQIFIADMIGFSALRDTGPLVTAIMLAGRSGSAFAAELGTMKVNEELDALTTMGLDPMRFLVLQRIVAAVLLTPLLTLYSMLMGLLGGIMVMRFLGFPPMMIYHEITARVGLSDFLVGIEKSIVFGFIIGAIGCLRGLQTSEGPRAVGLSTTRSVVAGILLVILANSIFSGVQYLLNK